jgi:hypothetical protein
MKSLFIAYLFTLFTASAALAQSGSCFPHCHRCEVYVADIQSGRVLKSIEFSPLTGEEELTTKVFRVPGTGLFVTASVFYTDESMLSQAGADSMELGLAVSRKMWAQAFASPNNAVAELTLNTFDTARVHTNIYSNGRSLLIEMQCGEKTQRGN